MEVPAGYVIGGWAIGPRIGSGQRGCVYAATGSDEATLSRPLAAAGPDRAAVKFTRGLSVAGQAGLRRCMARDEGLRARGGRPWAIGVRAVVDVRDEHLPRLDGAKAVVMELAEASLEDLIGGSGVNVERLLLDTVRAVAGMHEFVDGHGSVFHGDLKPSNVLVLADGGVRIGDLDLVQATEGTHLDANATHPGTADYLPPESFAGDPLVRASHDVWALGIIVHRVLSGGAHPFPPVSGSRAAALAEYAAGREPLHLHANLARFPDVWTRVVRACLHPDRTRRAEVSLPRLAEEIERSSPGSRRPPTRLHPRPTAPRAPVVGPDPLSPVPPRPVGPRSGNRAVALVTVLVVLAAVLVVAAGLSTVVHPEGVGAGGTPPGEPALGRVRSNSAFGGGDLCSKDRTVGPLTVRSCIHHSASTSYGGLVIHSTAAAGQRADAVWVDSTLVAFGNGLRSDPPSRQSVYLAPDDTITVITSPHGGVSTDCTASSGYLLADPGVVVRSPFKSVAGSCAPPSDWPLAVGDDPPPAKPDVAVPGGFAPADCAPEWGLGPPGSGLQYQACLYHHTDSPDRWNAGAQVRNASDTASAPTVLRFRTATGRPGQPDGSATVAEQDLWLDSLAPGATRSLTAADRRTPTDAHDACLVVHVWAVGTEEGSAAVSPYRDQTGKTCDP